jgi:hypothetical protein
MGAAAGRGGLIRGTRRAALALFSACILGPLVSCSAAPSPPATPGKTAAWQEQVMEAKMKVNEIRVVFDNGMHNAFTSIAWFRGAPYVAFRCGVDHVSPEGRVLVLRGNAEGDYWQPVASIYAGADTRDPKLLVTDKGLYVYCFSYRREKDNTLDCASGYAFSEDGDFWQPWVAVERDWIYWRPEWFGDTCYVAAYSTDRLGRVRLLRSADGASWQDICVLVDDEPNYANEVALAMEPGGRMWALIRRDRGSGRPLFGWADAPYADWHLQELPLKLEGPYMWIARGNIYISGRWYHASGLDNTAIFLMREGAPTPLYVLPSGGDTSYMGACAIPGSEERHWWLTYYSSHAYLVRGKTQRSAIYLADVSFE